MSLRAAVSIKEEEMDTEQDRNMEIKMSGKKMREGCMMTDKRADEGAQLQIISGEASAGDVQFTRFDQNDDAGTK